MAVPTVNNVQTNVVDDNDVAISGYTPAAGINSKLIVAVARESTTNRTVLSVLYGLTPLIKTIGAELDGGPFDNAVELWYLDDPLSHAPSGDITVLFSGGTGDSHMHAATLLGVKSGAPDATTFITSSDTPIGASLLPTDEDSIVVSAHVSGEVIDPAATAPHSEDAQTQSATGTMNLGHTDVSTPAATAVQWVVTGTNRSVLILAAWGRGLDADISVIFGRELTRALIYPEKTSTVVEVS